MQTRPLHRPLGRAAVALALVLAGGGVASARRLPRAEPAPPAAGAPRRPPVQVVPRGTISWTDTAVALRGRDGLQLSLDCPANGRPSSVWGTDVYTDDSSLCTAAVHAGFITPRSGGRITIEIRAGQAGYASSARHGVSSSSWGSWHGSFVVVAGSPGAAVAAGGPIAIDWSDEARAFSGMAGPITLACPAGGSSGSLWGSGVYTDDSSICTAAVHAGAITWSGGTVDIELRPGLASYPASTSNGVASASWGAWTGSFVILNAPGPTAPQVVAGPQLIGWHDHATAHRGAVGQLLDFECPAGGSLATVWGDGPYTDDSSICSAAVHAGLITTASGGVVTIEMTAGQASYPAATRHGVTTLSYGPWSGSYIFR